MKLLLLTIILINISLAKEYCYFANGDQICYKPFKDTKKLKKPIFGEKYYKSPDGNIYRFSDEILVKLKYEGAILYLVENYDIEFVDKKNSTTYIFKVKDKTLSRLSDFDDELFEETASSKEVLSILTTLNALDAVRSAKPYLKRKYRKSYKKPQATKVVKKESSGPADMTIEGSSGGGAGGRAVSISGAFK